MSIRIVIGKSFGDEGKGRVTDHFAKESQEAGRSVLVIRHNGGAQAGHTVTSGDKRFVFHQLSSGSIRHADTYWSDTFLPDLYMLGKEAEEFRSLFGFVPDVFASPDAKLVTVLDVIINQALESFRGDGRHGSCGMGINEAVERSRAGFAIRLGEVYQMSVQDLCIRLLSILGSYVPKRLRNLGLNDADLGDYKAMLSNETIISNWCRHAISNLKYISLESDRIIDRYDDVIFEGAQGLLLDEMNIKYAPHLTTSRTGLTNPVNFIRSAAPEKEEESLAVYVTRTYVTRHGAGPLPHETNFGFVDETNAPNDWQGTLRYGCHGSLEEFMEPVNKDVSSCDFKGKIAVFTTHLDETNRCFITAEGHVPYDTYLTFNTIENIKLLC